jgi:hypothetical protein
VDDLNGIRSQFYRVYSIFSSLKTDFLVLDKTQRIEIEVVGKSKGRKQIKGLTDAFVFKDGIEMGHANVIPLYLIGFLY